jgi:DNA-binding NtrC family response regulator
VRSISRSGFAPPTVLVVGTDRGWRRVLRAALDEAGYRVLEAASAAEALAICSDDHAPIDVLLGGAGADAETLANHLAAIRPGLRVLVSPGTAHDLLLSAVGKAA